MADPLKRDLSRGLEGREGEVYYLHAVKRWPQRQIAGHLGISQQRVSQILAKCREQIEAPNLAEIRDKSIRLHEDIIRRAFEMAEMSGAPIAVGKDGNILKDPEGGAVVRDYALRNTALMLALKAESELRKLLGADAATKVEATGSLRVEIVGVDPEALK